MFIISKSRSENRFSGANMRLDTLSEERRYAQKSAMGKTIAEMPDSYSDYLKWINFWLSIFM